MLNLFFYVHVSCFTSKTQPAVNGSEWRRRVTSMTPSDSSDGEIWEGGRDMLTDSPVDLGDVERVVHERVPTSDFLFPTSHPNPWERFHLWDTCRGSFLGASVLLKKNPSKTRILILWCWKYIKITEFKLNYFNTFPAFDKWPFPF